MKIITTILLFLWQLPQNVLGFILWLCFSRKKNKIEHFIVFEIAFYQWPFTNQAISLGRYIFVDNNKTGALKTLLHEYGHHRQSIYLGPLYLIIIGLPSIIGNIIYRLIIQSGRKPPYHYYDQPWERWANHLSKRQL